MHGLNHLRQATAELSSSMGDPRNRLKLAGREYWLALFDSASWSRDMQERSYSATSKLLARGSVDKTVRRMRNDAVGKTAELLRAFCQSAERSAVGSRKASCSADPDPCDSGTS